MKIFIVLYILLFITTCKNSNEETIEFGKLKVTKNPVLLPWGLTPAFIPENSLAINSIETDGRESFFKFSHDWDAPKMALFYEAQIKSQDWHLLQKEEKDTSIIFLMENQTKRLMSVVIRNASKGTIVKIFYRRNTNY